MKKFVKLAALLLVGVVTLKADDANIFPDSGDYLVGYQLVVTAQRSIDPDPLGFCACDSQNEPKDWKFLYETITFSGDADSSGLVDTESEGDKDVYAHVTYHWICPANNKPRQTQGLDDAQAKFKIGKTGIDGPDYADLETDTIFKGIKLPGDQPASGDWVAENGTPGAETGSSFTTKWLSPGVHSVTLTIEGVDLNRPIKVKPPSIEITEVKFETDHNVIMKNNSNWNDATEYYTGPDWTSVVNNPISHTKGLNVMVTLKIVVSPAVLGQKTYTVKGVGPKGMNFESPVVLTGGDNFVSFTSKDQLDDAIGYYYESIKWTVSLDNQDVGFQESGPHKVYITWGTPGGSSTTEYRIAWVVDPTKGINSLSQAADTLFECLPGSFVLNSDTWGPPNIWELHLPEKVSECPGLAKFVNAHFMMLGLGAGEYRFCLGLANGKYGYITDAAGCTYRIISSTVGHSMPTNHDDAYPEERLGHLDGKVGVNAYEATCFFDNKYYALGVDIFSTPTDVVKASFLTLQWRYGINITTNLHCSEVPWVEVP